MSKLVEFVILIPIIVLAIPSVYASESDAKRYSDGYNDGTLQGQTDLQIG